jgi:hypothetical protein
MRGLRVGAMGTDDPIRSLGNQGRVSAYPHTLFCNRESSIMPKRLRYVHPVDMVAHLWANRSQESARNPGDNFYFKGDTIYSYGNHFPIAHHVETKRGRAVLFTTRDYSVTTSGHKWTVLRACKHLTVFHVQHPAATDRKTQFVEYRERYVAMARKYTRARSNKPWILDSLRELVDEANRFAQFFGLRPRLSMPSDVSAKRLFVEYDRGRLVDLAINGRLGDCSDHELTAIVSDHLRGLLPAGHPCETYLEQHP